MPKAHPKVYQEERAILKAVKSLCGEMSRLSASIVRNAREGSSVPVSLLSRMHKTTELLAELVQYGFPHLSSLPIGEAAEALTAGIAILRKTGSLSNAAVDDLRKRALRRPRGRPEITRHLAARAEGMRRMNPKLTWQALADRLHPPDYPECAQPFRERLRRDVVRLRALLHQINAFVKKPSTT